MLSFFKKIVLCCFFIGCKYGIAQIKFTASLSSNQICKNDLVQLKLKIEKARGVPKIISPVFKDFILVRGPYRESNIALINGELDSYYALNYVLKPKAAGNFKFLTVDAEVDGQSFKSNTVIITVLNKLATNPNINNFNTAEPTFETTANNNATISFADNILKNGENISEKIKNNMFVQLDVDKTSSYLGEPIVATYKLYTRLKSESVISKTASFNGFSVVDLQPKNYGNYGKQKINGKDYFVYVISKSQLYPLQTGNIELQKTEVENNIVFIKEAYINKNKNILSADFLKNLDTSKIPTDEIVKQKFTALSNSLFVNIKPLPTKDIPINFKGAVGNFTISSILQKNTFTTDDVVKLKIIISGNGNMQLINIPQIDWPQGFETFEPIIKDEFNKLEIPISGKKIIDYSFLIAKTGIYTLPTITFSYFNVIQKKYITDSTKPIVLTVIKGVKKNEIENNKAVKQNSFYFNNYKWIAGILISIIAIAMFLLIKIAKKKKVVNLPRIETEENKNEKTTTENLVLLPKNWLAEAHNKISEDSNTFFKELHLGLINYLSTKLNLPVATITKKNIEIMFNKKNIDANTTLKLQQLFTNLEMQLYTPFANSKKMQELYYDAQEIIRLLDRFYK